MKKEISQYQIQKDHQISIPDFVGMCKNKRTCLTQSFIISAEKKVKRLDMYIKLLRQLNEL